MPRFYVFFKRHIPVHETFDPKSKTVYTNARTSRRRVTAASAELAIAKVEKDIRKKYPDAYIEVFQIWQWTSDDWVAIDLDKLSTGV